MHTRSGCCWTGQGLSHERRQPIRIVNRIGAFFAAMLVRAEAMQDLAPHVRRFWAPRMRQQLFEHLDAKQGEDVDALVIAG